jgi:hypothetical protein
MSDTSLPSDVAQFHLRDRMMRTQWSQRRPVLQAGGWSVFVDVGDMPTWNAWIRRDDLLTVVGTETWLILSGHPPALTRFLADIEGWPKNGLIYLPLDGVYRDAALAYAKATGGDVVRGKDALTALEERANRLLNYAADLVERPDDELLSQTVIAEMTMVGEDLTDFEARLDRVRQIVAVARTHAEVAVF